jgi:hypothetical protein
VPVYSDDLILSALRRFNCSAELLRRGHPDFLATPLP